MMTFQDVLDTQPEIYRISSQIVQQDDLEGKPRCCGPKFYTGPTPTGRYDYSAELVYQILPNSEECIFEKSLNMNVEDMYDLFNHLRFKKLGRASTKEEVYNALVTFEEKLLVKVYYTDRESFTLEELRSSPSMIQDMVIHINKTNY